MKTIINVLTAMIQIRADQIVAIENSFLLDESNKPLKVDKIKIVNKEIDALNIAIRAIQNNKPKRLKVITEDDISKIGEIEND